MKQTPFFNRMLEGEACAKGRYIDQSRHFGPLNFRRLSTTHPDRKSQL
ncbi:MAG TPA: hypothetical protein VFD62_13365 [Pyrinomonadaceae bacterium]|nr:hypothetical protein [Pyrinomonadaceae bacterium]